MKLRLLPLTALAFLAGCAATPAPEADRRDVAIKEIRAAEEAAIRAFGERDGAESASFYAPDAVLMMPNMKILAGAEIQSFLKEMMADPNFSMKFDTQKVDAARSGEIGYTRGAYTLTTTDPHTKKAVREAGKYLTMYARQSDGNWKIVNDIDNPDGPAVPVEAAR
jgi:uncharacterized protein (TIGR02246 family)